MKFKIFNKLGTCAMASLTAVIIGGLSSPSFAQTYPSKAVRMVVPFSAGASPDLMTRMVAEVLAKELSQPVLVENRPGSGGNIGADYVAKQPGDGYTIFVGTTGNMVVNKTLYKNLPYDPEKDFTLLTLAWLTSNVLIVPANSPYKTVRDVVQAAQAKPGSISYGSPGNGTLGHMIAEKFKAVTKTDIVHVPYKGQNQVITDLLGGHIQMSFETIGSALPMLQSGRVRALAIIGATRHPRLPNVPTFKEAGVTDIDELTGWAVFAVPSSTPAPIVNRLHTALANTLNTPSIRQNFEELGVGISITTPAYSHQLLHQDIQRWAQLVKLSGAQVD